MAIPKGYYGKIESRSSLAFMRNLHVKAGVIDSDYRGEVYVMLKYEGTIPCKLDLTEQPIAQMIIHRYADDCEIVELGQDEEMDATERGDGGFGSTDSRHATDEKEPSETEKFTCTPTAVASGDGVQDATASPRHDTTPSPSQDY